MATTNPVFQVLITSGNQAPLAAGNSISALLNGQVGVFNYHTGLSVGAASAVTDTKDVFIAVAINRNGGTAIQDFLQSAGQQIQTDRVRDYTHRCYAAPAPKIVDITGYTTKCEIDYGIKIELRNQETYALYGYNQFTKTWIENGGCCDAADCADCAATGDCNSFTTKLITQINSDPDNLVIADYLDYTTTPGTPVIVTAANYAAWIADVANTGDCLGIRLTSVPEAVYTYADINLKYSNPRGTDLIVTPIEGFQCNNTLNVFQQVGYEEGAGYDLKQLEYIAGGWNGRPGPYRVSTITGTSQQGFEFFASPAGKYSQFVLTYDVRSQSNFLHYESGAQVIIGVPCADTTTRNGLVAILDHILPQFGTLAGNTALCDCTGAAHTNELAVANNGIKISLA